MRGERSGAPAAGLSLVAGVLTVVDLRGWASKEVLTLFRDLCMRSRKQRHFDSGNCDGAMEKEKCNWQISNNEVSETSLDLSRWLQVRVQNAITALA